MTEYEITQSTLPPQANTKETNETNETEETKITQTDEKIIASDTNTDNENAIGEEQDTAVSESLPVKNKRIIKLPIKKSLIYILSGVSVLVFGISTAVTFSDLSINGVLFTRALLGDFFGGIKNIHEVASYEVEYTPIVDNPATIDSESRLETLTALESPTEQRFYKSDTLSISNETPYEPDMNEILSMERVIPPLDELHSTHGTEAPLVLILHTHATEAFSDSSLNDYRNTDITKNIVSVGTVIADRLIENGISTIHSTTLFDADDFTMAYYNASLEIREMLEKYPSISYIIDVHRDSIESNGVYVAPTVETSDGNMAQMMFVIGTDYGGSGHSTWRNNLSLATRLQASLNESTPNLMRSINLRSASFNEQYSNGSLLLEIGACASTPEEVYKSAEKFADALSEEIRGK